MPAGRPLKYTPEYLAELAVSLVEYAKSFETPFLKDWCAKNSVPSTHIHEIAKRSEEFTEALIQFKDFSESKIALLALNKKCSEWFAFQLLKNVANWRDKTEVEHSGEIGIIEQLQQSRSRIPEFGRN